MQQETRAAIDQCGDIYSDVKDIALLVGCCSAA